MTQLVYDVNQFNDHIAYASVSKSELVIPLLIDDNVISVLGLDSPITNRFNKQDKNCLEAI